MKASEGSGQKEVMAEPFCLGGATGACSILSLAGTELGMKCHILGIKQWCLSDTAESCAVLVLDWVPSTPVLLRPVLLFVGHLPRTSMQWQFCHSHPSWFFIT